MIKMLLLDVKNFIDRRKSILYSNVLFLIFCFGFKVFNFSLTLDNDWNIIKAYEKSYSNIDFFFYGNGRYTSGILRKIFSINGAFVPYISPLMATVLLGASAILICVIVDKLLENKVSNFAFFGFTSIYVSVPFLYSQNFAFDLSVDIEYFIALLITIIVYYLTFSKKNLKLILYCSIMLALAFNASQSRVVQYLCLYFFILLNKLIVSKDVSFKEIISFSRSFIICGIFGLIGYMLISEIGAKIINAQYAYIEGMIGWSNEQGIYYVLLNIVRAIKKIFWYKSLFGAEYNFITLSIFGITIIKIIFYNSKTVVHKIYIIVVFALFFISNFALCIALGNNMPYRTFVGTPIFLGAGWFFALQDLQLNKTKKTIVIILCTYVFVKQVLLLNTYFYSSYQTAELEKGYAIEIAHDILRANEGILPTQPVIFVGDYEVSTPQTVRFEGVGSTMLKWYEPIRKYNIMKAYGYSFNNSLMESNEANEQAAQIASNMPKWPADGSIYISDSMIVVKLSGSTIKEISKEDTNLLNLDNNSALSVNMWIDEISSKDNIFCIYGWSYINELNSSYTSMKIVFINDMKQYIMDVNVKKRPDVDNTFNQLANGNYTYSGINEQISLNSLDSGKYAVKLILQNGNNRVICSLNHDINI